MKRNAKKPFVVRTKLDGTEFFLKEYRRIICDWWDPNKRKESPFISNTLTQHDYEATRYTENKAKAAKKRAEKVYADIECTTERKHRLTFEVVNLQTGEKLI